MKKTLKKWELNKDSNEVNQLADFTNFVNGILLDTSGVFYVRTIERTCSQRVSKASKLMIKTKSIMRVLRFNDFGAIAKRVCKSLSDAKVLNYGGSIAIMGIKENACIYVLIDNRERLAYFSTNVNYMSKGLKLDRVDSFFGCNISLI